MNAIARLLFVGFAALSISLSAAAQASLPAFPGAEGFGAVASGGRGGQVITVTNLNTSGEGSLQAALETPGPRTIVFAVSGVIPTTARIVHGDVTIAGQTSPAGITMRGIVCDGHYEVDDCRNVIIQHVRSRPAPHILPAEDYYDALDDALRIDGARDIMIDHLSLANATDEVVQISMATNVTVQNTIMAETIGDHNIRGGMLLNYSHSESPQDNISIHHNLWYRITERLPEISCELTRGFGDDETLETPSLCGQQPLNIEVTNNLYWDPGFPLSYGDNDPNGSGYGDFEAGIFTLNMNLINNQMIVRDDFPYPMIWDPFVLQPRNQLYFAGNRMSNYPEYADLQITFCCNDFADYAPNTDAPAAQMLSAPHPFPPLTVHGTDQLVEYMLANAGAFPAMRDKMDNRYMDEVASGVVVPAERGEAGDDDAFTLTYEASNPPAPPLDSDTDGMPDAWEVSVGLNPSAQDHNGVDLSADGYTNLEVYLHARAAEVEGR